MTINEADALKAMEISIMHALNEEGGANEFELAKAALEACPYKRSQWINVNDELPEYDKDVLLGELDRDGNIIIADRGCLIEGDTREEWDEVEDGVCVKLWEDKEEDRWGSNYSVIEEPTHWMPLSTQPEESQ